MHFNKNKISLLSPTFNCVIMLFFISVPPWVWWTPAGSTPNPHPYLFCQRLLFSVCLFIRLFASVFKNGWQSSRRSIILGDGSKQRAKCTAFWWWRALLSTGIRWLRSEVSWVMLGCKGGDEWGERRGQLLISALKRQGGWPLTSMGQKQVICMS